MQKIKYIIIFTLLLAIAIITVQLLDYQKIATSLLQENRSADQTNTQLSTQITTLQETNTLLQEKVIELEEQLSLEKIRIENLTLLQENNYTTPKNQIVLEPYNKVQNQNTKKDIDLKPNITIDHENENKITGFGLEYKQNF